MIKHIEDRKDPEAMGQKVSAAIARANQLQKTYQEMRKMYNAQKKPMDSLKEQLEQLLGDLGQASKSPNKNKKANTGVARGQPTIMGFVTPLKREWEDEDDFD